MRYYALVLVAVCLAVFSVAKATAHNGNVWFQSRAGMEENIESKYRVDAASCRKHPYAHWTQDNAWSLRLYDHFICGVSSEVTGRSCVVVAHQTGGEWYHIVLTGYKFAKGPSCTPRDLARR